MTNSPRSILEPWLHPLDPEEFQKQHWTREAYWTAADSERLKFTEEFLPEIDLVTLLEYAVSPIKAWYLDDNTPVYSLTLGRKEAYHAYRAGLTLYFHLNASIHSRLIAQLSRELARPPAMFNVSIFATRRGGHTLPHVDGHENFTLQLRGTKRWKISPGKHWPGWNETSEQKNKIHEVFRIMRQPESWTDVSPIEMPPGGFLYCPAPFWHTVETLEDSLSLNVSIATTHTLADTLLPAIRTALLQHPDWSSREVGLWSSGNRRKQADKMVSELLQRLSEDLREIKSDDVLSAWNAAEEQPLPESIPANFVRNPFVACGIVAADVGTNFQIRTESSVRPGKTYDHTFPWKFYSTFMDLVTSRAIRHPGEFPDARELVLELLRYGVLRSCEPAGS
jgi:hypothetical protein